MASVEVVRVDAVGKVSLGTWTQRAGMRLAACVGSVGLVIIIIILVKWWCLIPTAPDLSRNLTPEQIEALLKNYKILTDQSQQLAIQMIETLIVKVILPLFTGILGYIFGAQMASENTNK